MQDIKRGDVFYADLSLVVGSEQGGAIKPILVLQNDVGNRFSPTVICCVLTTKVKKKMPTHVYLDAGKNNLDENSFALLEQLKTIDKMRLLDKMTQITPEDMNRINQALLLSVGLEEKQELCAV